MENGHFDVDRIESAPEAPTADAVAAGTRRHSWMPVICVSLLLVAPALVFLGYRIHQFNEVKISLVILKGGRPMTAEEVANLRVYPPEGWRSVKTHPVQYFELADLAVPPAELILGGPAKDDIPALTNPRFVPVTEVDYLQPADAVIGAEINGDARLFPICIMERHAAVNDEIGGVPIAVTFCPLSFCATTLERRVGDETIEFGVSGLLYNSNLLLYDRQSAKTESLWSQMKRQPVSGPDTTRQLRTRPVELTVWADWKERHPQGRVLWIAQARRRSPYRRYYRSPETRYPAQPSDSRLGKKTLVLGLWTDRAATALIIPTKDAPAPAQDEFNVEIDGRDVKVLYNPEFRTLRMAAPVEGVQTAYAYWFAWYAFHPNTEIHHFQ